MSTVTLPHVMSRSEFGWPLYLLDTEIFISVPFLPDRLGANWETAAEASPGCEELTAGIWAQMLYLSPIDPDRVTDAEAVQAADRVLADHGCGVAAQIREAEEAALLAGVAAMVDEDMREALRDGE